MSLPSASDQPARTAVVIALHKCGINLFAPLLRALGGFPVGAGIRASYAELAGQLRSRWGECGEAGGIPDAEWISRYPERLLALLPDQPVGTCLCLHSLPSAVLSERRLPAFPKIWFFLVRDPRARLVSLIGYLSGKAREAPSRTAWTEQHQAALAACATDDERVRYVIKALPGYTGQYRTHAWLMDHPAVHVVRFEDLVGAAGGGDGRRQCDARERIAAHWYGYPVAVPRDVSDERSHSRTFRTGRIDEWPHWFNAENRQLFLDLYGDVLDTYGYAREGGNRYGPNQSL